jgi:heme/copper-type cytochrome/quinol oxidase subunit 2
MMSYHYNDIAIQGERMMPHQQQQQQNRMVMLNSSDYYVITREDKHHDDVGFEMSLWAFMLMLIFMAIAIVTCIFCFSYIHEKRMKRDEHKSAAGENRKRLGLVLICSVLFLIDAHFC